MELDQLANAGPRGLAVRRLPRMQEVVGSNPTEGKNLFFTIYSIL